THSVRADAQLYRVGQDDRTAQSSARRGECLRLESGCSGGAVPSRGAEEREPGWISVGREEEGSVVGSGAFSNQQSAISKIAKALTAKDAKDAKEERILK